MLLATLQAAIAAERSAHGSNRRSAYRTTRHLLGGCRTIGIGSRALAVALHSSIGSVSARGSFDGPIPASTFAELANLPDGTMERWNRQHLLAGAGTDPVEGETYPASELIRTLLTQSPSTDDTLAPAGVLHSQYSG